MSREIDRQLRGVDARRAGAGVGDDFASGFGGAAKKLAGIAAGAFAGVKVGGFLKDAVNSASDAAEIGTKLGAIYGDAAGDIEAFGAQGAKALGQTSLQAKNAAATFGTFGKAAGLSAKDNAAFSTELAKLATDMASFSNTSPEEAIEALGAGLRGESEPLRKYGVLLDDASLRQEALAMGLITTTKEALTPQQKVLASHALIMKQTSDAQGDFERTSGGLANQQRILSASWEDAKGKLGEVFLPAVTGVVTAMNDKLFPILDSSVTKIGDFASGVKDTLLPAFDQVKSILTSGDFTGGPFEEDSPFVDFLFNLRDFGVATFDKLREIWDKLWDVGEKLWPDIESIAGSLADAVKTLGDNGLWFGLLDAFDKIADLMNDYLVPAFDWLARFMEENPDSVVAFVAVIGTAIAATKLWALAQAALNFVLTANPIGIIVVALASLAAAVVWAYNNVEWFRNLVDTAWAFIKDAIVVAWENVIKPSFDAMVARIEDLGAFFSWLWDTVSNVWPWIQGKIGDVWNWLRDNVFIPLGDKISAIGQFFSDLWAKVQEVWTWIQEKIGDAWTWINANVFAPMILGINTVMTWMSNLWTTVQGVWNNISTFFSDVAQGISDAVQTVKDAIRDITKAIEEFFTERLDNWGGTNAGGVLGSIDLGPGGARGMVVPGRDPGRRDNMLMPVRSEEAIMVPEFTHAVGGASGVYTLNRLAETGLLNGMFGPGMARGGVVGQKVHDTIVNAVLPLLNKRKTELLASSSDYGPVNMSGNAINTQAAIDFIKRVFGLTDVSGWRSSGSVAGSDHPSGKAIDAMIPDYRSSAGISLGTRLADWFVQNPANFGTKYVIWRDRINQNGQWAPYTHASGSTDDTMAHRNHVHISLLTGMAAATGQAIGESLAGGGGTGVERWRPMALQALAATGQSAAHVDRMLNQIRTESSGNPNAINLWDSNAMRGIPSGGLLQVIQPTFEAALRGTQFAGLISRGRFDPWANMISSILYGVGRYGSLERAYRGVAYAKGGIVPDLGGGTDSVRAWLTPGEGVFTPTQTDAIIKHAQALEAGYSGQVPAYVFNGDIVTGADPRAIFDEAMWLARTGG
jgi:hypothetical protein